LEAGVEGKVVGEHRQDRVDKLLTPEMADAGHRRRVMHFLEGIDAAILEANSAVIGKAIPALDRETFLRMAVRVAELRADYVNAGLALADQRQPSVAAIDDLANRRRAFEEMMAVMEAAERLIERGYSRIR
jgi:hypothetical protein